MFVRWLFAGLATALLIGSPGLDAQAADKDATLAFVRAVHKSAREAIVTAHCRVDFQLTIQPKEPKDRGRPQVQTCSAEYWFSLRAVRAKTEASGKEYKSDFIWKDSVRTSLLKYPSGEMAATTGQFSQPYIDTCDAWSRALFALNIPGTIFSVPFEKLLELADRVERAERKKADGRELIVVELFFGKSERPFDRSEPRTEDWTGEFHFDSSVNYLIRRVVYKSGQFQRDCEVLDFQEFPGGIFFPQRIVGKTGDDQTHETKISEIQVNHELPNDIFEVRFPPGIILYDTIRNTYYQVDEHGKRISEEKPMGRGGAVEGPLAEAASAASAPMSRTVTLKEPPSATRWILPVSIGILTLAAIGYLIRRWRSGAIAG